MTTDPIERALRHHVSVLCDDIGSRSGAEPGNLGLACDYIAQTLRELEYDVRLQSYTYDSPVHTSKLTAANVIAGPPATKNLQHFVLGAHYDTVPGTVGADDNASAVAVMLETARLLQDERRHVQFVGFTLEESPYFFTSDQGSRRYLKAHDRTVAAALVLEMVGYTSGRQHYPLPLRWSGYPKTGDFVGLIGNWRSRHLMRDALQAFRGIEGLKSEKLWVPFNGWLLPAVRLSDNSSFWDRGIPALMITDTAFMRNPNYHLPTDRPETLDFPFMAQVTRATAAALRLLTDR
jgi:Zn-dependent M28 family amino/carboxypeptidase